MSTESTVTADAPGDGPDKTQGAERAVGRGAEGPTGRRPLEPLTADEVAAATAILEAERGLGPEARFVFVGLHQPDGVSFTLDGHQVRWQKHQTVARRPDRGRAA